MNDNLENDEFEPALVPELLVSDIDKSLHFWHQICGFNIRYARPEESFAYIESGSAHLMLEQAGVSRNWITGPLEQPFGRGMNLQVRVTDTAAVAASLAAAGIELFMQPETRWYRVDEDDEAGVQQFLVTDPDGYLIRFQSSLGRRPFAR